MDTLRIAYVAPSVPPVVPARSSSAGRSSAAAILAGFAAIVAVLSGTVGAAYAATQLELPELPQLANDQNHPARAAHLWSDGPDEDEQCVADALDHQEECEDKDCAAHVAAALVACATTENAICADAPPLEDAKQSVSWARERCNAQGRGDRHCLVLMRALQERCDARYGGLRL